MVDPAPYPLARFFPDASEYQLLQLNQALICVAVLVLFCVFATVRRKTWPRLVRAGNAVAILAAAAFVLNFLAAQNLMASRLGALSSSLKRLV